MAPEIPERKISEIVFSNKVGPARDHTEKQHGEGAGSSRTQAEVCAHPVLVKDLRHVGRAQELQVRARAGTGRVQPVDVVRVQRGELGEVRQLEGVHGVVAQRLHGGHTASVVRAQRHVQD